MIMIILSSYTPDEEAEAEAEVVKRRRRVALCSPLRLLAYCLPEERRGQKAIKRCDGVCARGAKDCGAQVACEVNMGARLLAERCTRAAYYLFPTISCSWRLPLPLPLSLCCGRHIKADLPQEPCSNTPFPTPLLSSLLSNLSSFTPCSITTSFLKDLFSRLQRVLALPVINHFCNFEWFDHHPS